MYLVANGFTKSKEMLMVPLTTIRHALWPRSTIKKWVLIIMRPLVPLSNLPLFVLYYVDDIIVTGSNVNLVNYLISSFASHFCLKDFGPLHYFLGIQVTSQSDGIHLSQSQYIEDLLLRSKMDGAKPRSTPWPILTFIEA
jgi:Reverse transcriptase (RNA-dependent DNA polymerase)